MELSVTGAYLPRLDQSRLAQFITDEVTAFSKGILNLRARGFAQSMTDATIAIRCLEIPEELDYDLQRAALFEVEVRGNTQKFLSTSFVEERTHHVSWEPVYLSLDGTRIVSEWVDAPPELSDFRVAFYLHEWPPDGKLIGPTGHLPIPPFAPVPERLWTLAPYSTVD